MAQATIGDVPLTEVRGDEGAWKRLASLARQRRDDLGLTQAELGQLAGTATQTVHRFEQGNKPTRHSSSWSKIERALGWLPGSIDAILDGGEPIVGSYDGRFLRVQIDNTNAFIHDLVRKITIEIDPDAPQSRVIAAEAVAEEALREARLLPALDDESSSNASSNE